jgi:post-segregation antitoxin (ccd killing protein)
MKNKTTIVYGVRIREGLLKKAKTFEIDIPSILRNALENEVYVRAKELLLETGHCTLCGKVKKKRV